MNAPDTDRLARRLAEADAYAAALAAELARLAPGTQDAADRRRELALTRSRAGELRRLLAAESTEATPWN